MPNRLAVLGTTLVLLAGGAIAASASTPPAGKSYFSKLPNVSITVGKASKSVTVFVSCFTTPGVGDDWSSPKIPLNHGVFKYDKSTKIGTEAGATFGTVTGTVLITGTFNSGKFKGTMQIAGSACAKGSYTAKFNKGGGSGG
jgi:hypothetical protein